jgi:hypothetical protein
MEVEDVESPQALGLFAAEVASDRNPENRYLYKAHPRLVRHSMGTPAHLRIRVSSLISRKPCTSAVATMSWSAGSL